MRVPRPAAQTRPRPRRRLGDPAALPRRLLRPPAGLRHGARPADQDRRRARSALSSTSSTSDWRRAKACGSTGDTGTGKTTLAMLVSKAALEAGHSVAIYSLPKLLARIRRTYDAEPGGDSYLAFFERLTSVDLLHIDDLGAEKRSRLGARSSSTRWSTSATRSSARCWSRRNFDGVELEEQIGRRIVSRLSRDCDRAAAALRRGQSQGDWQAAYAGTNTAQCSGDARARNSWRPVGR